MILKLRVYPGSGREEIVRVSEDFFKVYLKKHACDNKANIELLKILKKYFDCQHIKIIKGLKSRDKVIEIC